MGSEEDAWGGAGKVGGAEVGDGESGKMSKEGGSAGGEGGAMTVR